MEEFTYTNKLALLRRAEALDARVDGITARLDRLFGKKLTDRRARKIDRLVNRLESVRSTQEDVADELTNYQDVEGTPDTYEFGIFEYDTLTANGQEFDYGRASIIVTDSADDDTFEPGDQLTVQSIGKRRFGGSRMTFKTLPGVEVDGVTVFNFGSSTLGEQAVAFDQLQFKVIDSDKNTIFSSDTIDVSNIV